MVQAERTAWLNDSAMVRSWLACRPRGRADTVDEQWCLRLWNRSADCQHPAYVLLSQNRAPSIYQILAAVLSSLLKWSRKNAFLVEVPSKNLPHQILQATVIEFLAVRQKTSCIGLLLVFSNDDIVRRQNARTQSLAVHSLQILTRAHENYDPERSEHRRIACVP